MKRNSTTRRLAAGTPLLALALLSSCSLSSSLYIAEHSGYAMTWGDVVRVEQLHTESPEHLRDGLAFKVKQDGCRVTIRFPEGEHTQTLDLLAGSILVYGQQRDYVLQPYRASAAPSGAESPASAPQGPEDLQGASESPPVVETSKLEARPSVAPEQAVEAYREAQELIEADQLDKALQTLEEAYRLDSQNLQIADSLVSLLKKMGLSHYSKGEWDRALVYWERVLEIRPQDKEALQFHQRAKTLSKKM